MLESAQAAVVRNEALDDLFETYYEPKTERGTAVRTMLIQWFQGDDHAARCEGDSNDLEVARGHDCFRDPR